MLRNLFFLLALLAPCAARAQSYSWNIPSSVPSGQSYYVDFSGGLWYDSQDTLYKNGYYFASGWQSTGGTGGATIDYGPKTANFTGSFYDWNYGTGGSDSQSVLITAPASQPTVSVTAIPSSLTTNQSFSVSASAHSPTGHLSSLGIRWRGVGQVGGSWSISGSDVTSPSVSLTAPSTPGTIELWGEVWDSDGNGTVGPSLFVNVGAPPTYSLSVSNGSGSGSYTAGTVVSITANAPQAGYYFGYWTQSSGPGTIGSASSSSTTFTMGAANASVYAYYLLRPTYTLTVINGTGGWSGLYQGDTCGGSGSSTAAAA